MLAHGCQGHEFDPSIGSPFLQVRGSDCNITKQWKTLLSIGLGGLEVESAIHDRRGEARPGSNPGLGE